MVVRWLKAGFCLLLLLRGMSNDEMSHILEGTTGRRGSSVLLLESEGLPDEDEFDLRERILQVHLSAGYFFMFSTI